MKSFKIKKAIALLLICFVGVIACKKDSNTSTGSTTKDLLTANDYVFNLATKKLTPTSTISANVKSEVGVKLIYSYLVRTGLADSLVKITYATDSNKTNLDVLIPETAFSKANMAAAASIRVVVKRVDNSSDELLLKLTSFQPPLPKLENFPVSKLPDTNSKIVITGNASSLTGLDKIEILDDSKGAFTIVTTIGNLAGAKTYAVNYSYTYRAGTANLKIIAYDTFGIKTEVQIKVPALPYALYKDVTMGSQGNSTTTVTNNHFFMSRGTTAGSCDLAANESNLDFLFYGTSTNPTFYSPTNATNIAKNYYCNGANNIWGSATDFTKLKPTRFRVLVAGDAGVDDLYTKFNANNISDLDDTGFFAGISLPSSSTSKYDNSSVTSGGTTFGTTTGYLIWARVPTTTAATSYKNCLIRVKESVNASNVSTIKFDIYVQK